MNRGKEGFAPILILLVIVAVIGIVILAGKGKLGSIIKFGSPVPSTTSDPTANWKTYDYPKFSYSFQVPSTYIITETESIPPDPSVIQGVFANETKASQGKNDVTIYIRSKNLASSLKDLVVGWTVQKDTKVVSGKVWTMANSVTGETIYLTQIGANTYSVDGQNIQFVDQVLSTFKFENSNGLLTYKSSKLENSSFSDFSISYFSDWIVKETKNSFYDKSTTLTKDGSSISIIQHTQGGNVCLFSDSRAFDGPSVDLKSVQYTELKTSSRIVFRRYLNNNSFYFCEGNTGTFESPTSIGIIIYTFPSSYDAKIITEMDDIIKTISVSR